MKISVIIIMVILVQLMAKGGAVAYDHERYVNVASGADGNDGLTSGTAWQNLHFAVNDINNDSSILAGETVVLYVAPGTYNASVAVSFENVTITRSDFTINGEGAGTVILDGTGADSAYWYDGIVVNGDVSNVVIMDMVIRNFSPTNASGIKFNPTNSAVSGNRVIGCEISGNDHGIYMYADSAASTPDIVDCNIHTNQYGIWVEAYMADASPGIFENLIHDNSQSGIYITTMMGGNAFGPVIANSIYNNPIGIQVTAVDGLATPEIKGNSIHSNTNYGLFITADGDNSSPSVFSNKIYDNPTGIFMRGSTAGSEASPNIINNVIYGTPSSMTYGVWVETTAGNSNPIIQHNTIVGGSDAGVFFDVQSGGITSEVRYCIITDFTGGGSSYGIFNLNTATVVVDYTNAWNNATANIQGTVTVPTGNFSLDPGYVDSATNNYSLPSTSPFVDAVPAAASDPVTYDLKGTSRPRDGNNDGTAGHDLGAFEYPFAENAFTMPGGTGLATDYRLLSLPLDTGSTSLSTVLTDIYGAYDTTQWRAFAWNGTDYNELATSEFDSLTYDSFNLSHSGKAFWVISLDSAFTNNTETFSGKSEGNKWPYEIELAAGWNLFSHPWPASAENPSIELGNIAVENDTDVFWLLSVNNTITEPRIFSYTGSGASGYLEMTAVTDLVESGRGYWIYVNSVPAELIIPPDNAGGYFSASKVATGPAVSFKKQAGSRTPPPPPGVGSSAIETDDVCFITSIQ